MSADCPLDIDCFVPNFPAIEFQANGAVFGLIRKNRNFDRFNSLSNEELESELQSYAVQLAQDPEVQARAEERQRKRGKHLKKHQPDLATARVSLPRGIGPIKKITSLRLDQVVIFLRIVCAVITGLAQILRIHAHKRRHLN